MWSIGPRAHAGARTFAPPCARTPPAAKCQRRRCSISLVLIVSHLYFLFGSHCSCQCSSLQVCLLTLIFSVCCLLNTFVTWIPKKVVVAEKLYPRKSHGRRLACEVLAFTYKLVGLQLMQPHQFTQPKQKGWSFAFKLGRLQPMQPQQLTQP